MYVDSLYIAKFYVNEPDAAEVRRVIAGADTLVSSAWSVGEVTCAFHRHLKDGHLTPSHVRELTQAFLDHVQAGVWRLIPVSEPVLLRSAAAVSTAPAELHLRARHAVHLVTAQEAGEREVWSNDRHLLAAAPHFGLSGRTAAV